MRGSSPHTNHDHGCDFSGTLLLRSKIQTMTSDSTLNMLPSVRYNTSVAEFKNKSSVLCDRLESMRSQIAEGETRDGLSWLEVKNQMLMGYLIDTNHVVYSKLKGKRPLFRPFFSEKYMHTTSNKHQKCLSWCFAVDASQNLSFWHKNRALLRNRSGLKSTCAFTLQASR